MELTPLEQKLRNFINWLFRRRPVEPLRENPIEFEERIARLYEGLGFTVDRTKQSRDGGVDFYARRETEVGNEEQIAVQCKLYTNTVGVEAARALYGVINDQQHLTRGVLVTSSVFSPDCQQFIAGKRLDLIAGEQLRQLTEESDLARLRDSQSLSEHLPGELRTVVRTELHTAVKGLRRSFGAYLALGLLVLAVFFVLIVSLIVA